MNLKKEILTLGLAGLTFGCVGSSGSLERPAQIATPAPAITLPDAGEFERDADEMDRAMRELIYKQKAIDDSVLFSHVDRAITFGVGNLNKNNPVTAIRSFDDAYTLLMTYHGLLWSMRNEKLRIIYTGLRESYKELKDWESAQRLDFLIYYLPSQ